jgi:hypothetical protein
MEFLILIVAAIILDVAALRWGFDSTDDIDSPEWERRRQWYDLCSENIVQAQRVRNVHLN